MTWPDDVTVWIGLDVGKDNHFADVLDHAGERLFSRPLRNDQTDLERLIDKAAAHGAVALVIDQPGSIAQLAIAIAAQRNVPVAYVPGLVMRRAADLYPGEAKTDRRDAYVIANTARTHARQLHWLDTTSNEALDELRVLNGYDIDLAADINRTTNRVRDALTAISPALERVLGHRLNQSGPRKLLAKWSTPTSLRSAGSAKISKLLVAAMPRVGTKIAAEITTALDAQTITLPAEVVLGQVISELAIELDRLYERRTKLEERIEEVFRSHPFGEVLLSMPGIGPRTGARILAEIGHPDRFSTGDKLAAYAGLAPVTRQSGKSINGEIRSRRGNHRLKNAMFLSAFASLKGDPASKSFYDRKRAEGKRHNAALICLARRRCDVILAMLNTGEHYTVEKPQNLSKAA
jgi:transposase